MTSPIPGGEQRIATLQTEIRSAAIQLKAARERAIDTHTIRGATKALAGTTLMQGALRFEITEAAIGFLAGLFAAISSQTERERNLHAFIERLRRRVLVESAPTITSKTGEPIR
jgi:hypothetical protein